MNRSTTRNLEQVFRIRGKLPNQERLRTLYYTLEQLINYAIERSFEISSIDRSMMINGKNAKRLFENDLVRWECIFYGETLIGKIQFNKMSGKFNVAKVHNPELSGEVKYSEFYTDGNNCFKQNFGWGELEQIGNVHDNPEMIGENQSFLKE